MLLILLTFFGTFILAVIASQRFATWYVLHSKTQTIRLTLCALVACLGFLILAYRVPFRALWVELLLVLAGTSAMTLIFFSTSLGDKASPIRSTQPGCLCVLLLIPLLPMVSFTMVGRVGYAQRIAVELIGPVSQKYLSNNHKAPSLSVTAQDGSTHTLEGVELSTWNSVVQGSSILNKPAWSAFGDLDGKRVRVVARGAVGFATLPD